MKRHMYKGYVIDTDNLGRVYIYNTASPYSEDSDKIILGYVTFSEALDTVDAKIAEAAARQW